MCGAGCAQARDEVIKLAQTLKAPVVHALRGKNTLSGITPIAWA